MRHNLTFSDPVGQEREYLHLHDSLVHTLLILMDPSAYMMLKNAIPGMGSTEMVSDSVGEFRTRLLWVAFLL